MADRGRKSKLTPETQERLVQAISVGSTYEHACLYAGIDYSTFAAWMASAADGDKRFIEFSEAIKQAEGRALVKWQALIDKAAQEGTWQAAAWKLERRYPQDYGRTVQDHNIKAKIDITSMSDEELEKIARGEA